MMRQAGATLKVYQELSKKHPYTVYTVALKGRTYFGDVRYVLVVVLKLLQVGLI